MTKKDSQKKGLHIGIKILITVLIVLAVLALLIAIGGLLFFNHYYNKMDYVPLDTTEEIFYSIEDETDLPPVTDETPAKTDNSSGEINILKNISIVSSSK